MQRKIILQCRRDEQKKQKNEKHGQAGALDLQSVNNKINALHAATAAIFE